MARLKLIIVILSCMAILNCDPKSCRDCETFNFDLSNWSLIDDSIKTKLTFLDEQLNEVYLSLIETNLSEPYRECQITSSPESVGCFLTRSSTYLVDGLGFEMKFAYEQIEVPGGNTALNDVMYKILLRETDANFTIETSPIYILDEQRLEINTSKNESISQSGESYIDVIDFQIDRMFNSETKEEIEPQLISRVTFQIPNGIVGFVLADSTSFILKSE